MEAWKDLSVSEAADRLAKIAAFSLQIKSLRKQADGVLDTVGKVAPVVSGLSPFLPGGGSSLIGPGTMLGSFGGQAAKAQPAVDFAKKMLAPTFLQRHPWLPWVGGGLAAGAGLGMLAGGGSDADSPEERRRKKTRNLLLGLAGGAGLGLAGHHYWPQIAGAAAAARTKNTVNSTDPRQVEIDKLNEQIAAAKKQTNTGPSLASSAAVGVGGVGAAKGLGYAGRTPGYIREGAQSYLAGKNLATDPHRTARYQALADPKTSVLRSMLFGSKPVSVTSYTSEGTPITEQMPGASRREMLGLRGIGSRLPTKPGPGLGKSLATGALGAGALGLLHQYLFNGASPTPAAP